MLSASSAATAEPSAEQPAEPPAESAAELPVANHPEFIAVPRPRATSRNVVWKAPANEEKEVLKVLNAPCVESMPDGLDIYGDLCHVPKPSERSAEVPPPGAPKFRPRARNLVWKAENPTRPASCLGM